MPTGQCASAPLADSEIFRRHFAAVLLFFVAHLSALVEAAQAGSFDGRDMDELVLAAGVGLNEDITFLVVVPLHNTCCHVALRWKMVIGGVVRRHMTTLRIQ